MKLLIQHKNCESEYSDEDLKREAQRIARKYNGKVESSTIVVGNTDEGSRATIRLKVVVRQNVPNAAAMTEYVAL